MPPIHFTRPALRNQVFRNVSGNTYPNAGRDRLPVNEKTGPYLDKARRRAVREQFAQHHYAAMVILTTAAAFGTAIAARMMARAPMPSLKKPASDEVSKVASFRMTA